MSTIDDRDFLSGSSGTRGGKRAIAYTVADAAAAAARRVAGIDRALDRAAAAAARRRILVTGIYRPASLLPAQLPRLRSARHDVTLAFGTTAEANAELAASTARQRLRGGKFENLNAVLAELGDLDGYDWVLVTDDDVELPRRFLDRFVGVCEALRLDLAQPAQSRRSHAAWPITRTSRSSIVRLTRFVEIGPVTAFAARPARVLLPFPSQRYGWGLSFQWARLADERGWRLGIVDALPVRHESRPVASDYEHARAVEEARAFLASTTWLPAREAARTLEVHRRLPA